MKRAKQYIRLVSCSQPYFESEGGSWEHRGRGPFMGGLQRSTRATEVRSCSRALRESGTHDGYASRSRAELRSLIRRKCCNLHFDAAYM